MTHAQSAIEHLWLAPALAGAAAAVVWLAVAVVVSRNRITALQVCSVVLACAHLAGAGRVVLVGCGCAQSDAAGVAAHFAVSLACACVGVCVLCSPLAEAWRPSPPDSEP